MRRALVIAAQSAISAGLLAWMFRDGEFRREAAEVLGRASPLWTAAALACAGAGALLFFGIGNPTLMARLPAGAAAAGVLIKGNLKAIGGQAATALRDA
ncbi:MAG: hypothetical protein N2322_07800, partial [Terrimicrobiaceae bacterium]|nr:hypothetical protein [Terrimicrobiaceae bacterium]